MTLIMRRKTRVASEAPPEMLDQMLRDESLDDRSREYAFRAGYDAAVRDDATVWGRYANSPYEADYVSGYNVGLVDLREGTVGAADTDPLVTLVLIGSYVGRHRVSA